MTDTLKVCKCCKVIVDKRFIDLQMEHLDCIRDGLRQIRTHSNDFEWAQLMKRFDRNRVGFLHLLNLEREEV